MTGQLRNQGPIGVLVFVLLATGISAVVYRSSKNRRAANLIRGASSNWAGLSRNRRRRPFLLSAALSTSLSFKTRKV
jgi:hypothetical protein